VAPSAPAPSPFIADHDRDRLIDDATSATAPLWPTSIAVRPLVGRGALASRGLGLSISLITLRFSVAVAVEYLVFVPAFFAPRPRHLPSSLLSLLGIRIASSRAQLAQAKNVEDCARSAWRLA